MTFTIPPDSPKAAMAAAFGRELVIACKARNVSLKELERVAGVGHTTLDNYRRGLILPKTETALRLAEALRWPKLAELIRRFRTLPCARRGCGVVFRNDGGNRKAYCSEMCRRIAQNVRAASRAARSSAATGSGRRAFHEVSLLRSGLRIADERNVMLAQSIEAMCRSCEPEGTCRTGDCPLRPFSPLPLATRDVRPPRTIDVVRRESMTPGLRAAMLAGSLRRWATPGERGRQSARSTAMHASMSPEERDAWRAKVGMAGMDPARRSAAALKAAETRRRRAAELAP